MSNFEKIQSDELSGREDYEAMQELEFDGEFCGDYADAEWDDHWDEFDSELEEINSELAQEAHLNRFVEIFGVVHELEPRDD